MRADLLIVGQTPPPHHGQAMVTAMLFENDWEDMRVECLRMAYSDSIHSVGRASIGKILHLVMLIFKTWSIVLRSRPRVLYYPPASASKTPVLRDVVYLALVRWCFKKTVFHYHAGGLPDYLRANRGLAFVAKPVYSRADVSIDVIKTEPPTGLYFSSKENVAVWNGMDVQPRARERVQGATFQILYVGILNEGKGIKEMVKTASIMLKRSMKFEFKVVGGWGCEDFQGEINSLIEACGLKDYFEFTGPLQGEEKWQAYADADCFFFPSHYEAETFGLVLVEAMAFGLPLVTTRWSGIPRVVKGGRCAFLCDVRSPDQFAEALIELDASPAKRREMGDFARRHYKKNYTRERFVGEMGNVFRNLLKKSKD